MSDSGPRERLSRKGQFSCNFCRVRKLRCDRPLPCTNCRSRGKTCEFNPTPTSAKTRQPNTPVSNGRSPQPFLPAVHQPYNVNATFSQTASQQTPTATQTDLLAEVQALRKLTHDLEQRVVQSTATQQQPDHNHSIASPGTSDSLSGRPTPVSSHGQTTDIVSHLQLVSMSQISQSLIGVDDVVFRIEHIRSIPQAPAFIAHLDKPTTCIWLPHRSESQALLNHYLEAMSSIQHVLHRPSLSAIVDDAYRQIEGLQPLKPGCIILLLSIIAGATHVWVPCDSTDSESSPFLSCAQAHAQTTMWIKATHSLLNAVQNAALVDLETVQGVLILGCVVANLEGVSLRYRTLLSTGFVFARELRLHRIEQDTKASGAITLKEEIGRRVWWYLVATDWYVSSKLLHLILLDANLIK